MALDILHKRYKDCRSQFLSEALEHAKMLCVPPDTFVVGRKRSDQYWLRLFSSSSEKVTSEHVGNFLSSFQLTNRVGWDRRRVADLINKFRNRIVSDIGSAVTGLSLDLPSCITTKIKGQRTSAASKVAFFAKPREEVFIWDINATRSARFRDWLRTRVAKPRSFDRLYTRDGKHDYASFWNACTQALAAR